MNAPTLDQLTELARRVPAPPEQEFKGASYEELRSLEARISRSLPSELRQWLQIINGAHIGPGGVFGTRPRRDYLSIEKYLSLFPEWVTFGWIPVASDEMGNYWVVVPNGPDGSPNWVAFINTESDPNSVDRYAASDFMYFMRFCLRRSWANLGGRETKSTT